MPKYEEQIADRSIWLSATPTPLTAALPFHVREAGHFIARKGYEITRNTHNSYLLLFTVSGMGTVISGGTELLAKSQNAIIIDCHIPHRYFASDAGWEFYWIHFNGAMAKEFYDILYSGTVKSVAVNDANKMLSLIGDIMGLAEKNDILSSLEISSHIHGIFNITVASLLESEQIRHNGQYYQYIKTAVDFIHENYTQSITVDDIINKLHISKFHFIRLFRRTVGTTPYNYIMAYRINESKILLRNTDKPISEIAELCGFSDTSNFIRQFKKHCSEKPTAYRRDFTLYTNQKTGEL